MMLMNRTFSVNNRSSKITQENIEKPKEIQQERNAKGKRRSSGI